MSYGNSRAPTPLRFTEYKPVPQEIDYHGSGSQKEKPYNKLHLEGKIMKQQLAQRLKQNRQKNPEQERENNPGPVHGNDQYSVVLHKKGIRNVKDLFFLKCDTIE
jgi:hypothetical protein